MNFRRRKPKAGTTEESDMQLATTRGCTGFDGGMEAGQAGGCA